MTQDEIRELRAVLQRRVDVARAAVTELQIVCTHPNASRVYKANTGNYDPGCNCYWVEHKCPDCGKQWDEDQ